MLFLKWNTAQNACQKISTVVKTENNILGPKWDCQLFLYRLSMHENMPKLH